MNKTYTPPNFDQKNYERGRVKETPIMTEFCQIYQVFEFKPRVEFDKLDFNVWTIDGSNYHYRAEVKTSSKTPQYYINGCPYKLSETKHKEAIRFKKSGIDTYLIVQFLGGDIYWLPDLASLPADYEPWNDRYGNPINDGEGFMAIPIGAFEKLPKGASGIHLRPSGISETRIEN